eukprot:6691829-Prymnesium_polylepis.1
MVHSTLSRAFWQWRSVAATRRGQLARVRRAVMFMSHTQAGRCWNAWVFEVRRRQRACAVAFMIGRVARHMMQRSLARGLAGWRSAW